MNVVATAIATLKALTKEQQNELTNRLLVEGYRWGTDDGDPLGKLRVAEARIAALTASYCGQRDRAEIAETKLRMAYKESDARIATLEAALRPFAESTCSTPGNDGEACHVYGRPRSTWCCECEAAWTLAQTVGGGS